MDNPQAYFGRLKPIYLFRGLKDEQLLGIAREFEVETRPAGEVIFQEGSPGDNFYILHRGEVRVTRLRQGQPVTVAVLAPGDFFGEGSLLHGRPRNATITAVTAVEVLRLSRERFNLLLSAYPEFRANLQVVVDAHALYRQLKFNWLQEGEVVYLVARRHAILLWQALMIPLSLSILLVLAVVAVAGLFNWGLAAWLAGLGALPLAGWIAWVYVDWANDYYIATNRRVAYLEKIVGLYDSRVESPINAIMAVNVLTASTTDRLLNFGDVEIRTFSGPILFKAVANPRAMAALVEEHWNRSRTRAREAETDAMKNAIRRRIEPPKPPTARPAPPTPAVKAPNPLRNYFSFQMRFDRGDSVIYRKHWFILIENIWIPSALFLADVGLIGLKLAGVIPASIGWPIVLLVALLVFIPLAGWWLYLYEDWRNDLYQVTSDQIVDIYKRPFGQETRKSASLSNIMGMKYERPGLLGLFLNFGSVVATVAGQEFRFDGVFDPVGVQNDIYRRMEAQKVKKEQTDTARRRDEIAEWLGAYHSLIDDLDDERRQPQQPPPSIGGA